MWDDLPVVKDEPKPSVLKGTIQHHILGGGRWRTVMDVEGKRYSGTSVIGNGDFTFKVETVK